MGKIFMTECHRDCAVPQLSAPIGTQRKPGEEPPGPRAAGVRPNPVVDRNDILQVSATIRIVHPERPTEDTAVVVLEHENGRVSFYHMTGCPTEGSTGRTSTVSMGPGAPL